MWLMISLCRFRKPLIKLCCHLKCSLVRINAVLRAAKIVHPANENRLPISTRLSSPFFSEFRITMCERIPFWWHCPTLLSIHNPLPFLSVNVAPTRAYLFEWLPFRSPSPPHLPNKLYKMYTSTTPRDSSHHPHRHDDKIRNLFTKNTHKTGTSHILSDIFCLIFF